MNKELMGASTGLLVLAVLAKKASYGYQILRELNEESQGMFLWQEGTLYPVLHKLEQEELVRSQWQEAETGRKRKYYYITAGGRDALAKRVEEWGFINQMVLRLGDAAHEQLA